MQLGSNTGKISDEDWYGTCTNLGLNRQQLNQVMIPNKSWVGLNESKKLNNATSYAKY